MSRDRSRGRRSSGDRADEPIWVEDGIDDRAAAEPKPLRPRTLKPRGPAKAKPRRADARRMHDLRAAALEADRERRSDTRRPRDTGITDAPDPTRGRIVPVPSGPPPSAPEREPIAPGHATTPPGRTTVRVDSRLEPDPAPRPGRPARGRRAAVAAAIGLVLAVSGVGVWGLLRTTDHHPEAVSADPPEPTAPTTAPRSTTPRTTAPPVHEPITIAFAGDIYGEALPKEGFVAGMSDRLAPMAPLLSAADLTVANLETAITERGTPYDKQFTFRAPPEILDVIADSGIDVVSMANNHGMDFGPVGLQDSLAAKATSPIPVIGIGANEDEAFAPAHFDIKGRRIAVIGATQVIGDSAIPLWTARPDHAGLASAKQADRLTEEVRRARVESDIVVVFLHWGIEKDVCPSRAQRELAQQLSDAGADIVVGGHAHRVQGGGFLGPTAVHYGLGNFAFYSASEDSAQTGVLTVTVGPDGVSDQTWHPGRIDEFTPVPLAGAEADAALAHWHELRSCAGLSAVPSDGSESSPAP